MMRILLSFLFIPLMALSFAPTALVHADTAGGTDGTALINPLKSTTLEAFIADILQIVVKVGSVIVILMLVYVGFKFVTARGEPGAITEARTALMWTLIGALILLGAQAIAIAITATVAEFSA